MTGKKTRLFYLDFIRAVSMLMIVIYHFNMSLQGHSVTARDVSMLLIPNDYLGIGVSVFLALSGAALMHTYQNGGSLKTFFKKRFMSIYPMFWVAYILAFLYMFYTYLSINHQVDKKMYLLTLLGFDGYLLWARPNFYILGEWFLGLIILFYLIFPLLRKLIVKFPIFLLLFVVTIFIVTVETYTLKMPVLYNPLVRLPEFLFGMYFIRYVKEIRFYQFAIAACFAYSFMLIDGIPLNPIYKFTIIGVSLYVVLAYIGQQIRAEKLQKPFTVISKYSYAIFLVHHVVIGQLLIRFSGKGLTLTETYVLFLLACAIIYFIALILYRITDKITGYFGGLSIKQQQNIKL